ncbi:alpha/beta hydrolase [Cellulomonas edaphi]|uniref:Alpha/beta hydrolase n=1 Tax=Cellulomonas edaphi TaxID=3053468 RepID=A0ABT7S8V7_9CELL|nr:hypothetical protein [Cellulomons edaphi]MDM7832064.1 hypothetical protein [Cellulomons edaphi]
MNVRRWSLVLGAALAVGLVGAPAGQAASEPPEPAPHVSSADGITVATDALGSTVTWKPRTDVPMGDARPEFRVGDQRIGVPVPSEGALALRVDRRLRPAQVSVVSGGRVLAGAKLTIAELKAGGSGGASRADTVPTVPAVSRVLDRDPAKPGRYRTSAFTYALPSVHIPGYPAAVEMRGHVVAPVGAAGRRGVVLFLHGRHGTCYSPGGDEVSIDWPCAGGMKAIPSYLGYTQQQKLLASQGFVTVSISANGINGQDDMDIDSGAAARAVLVRKHLDVFADWAAGKGAGPAARSALAGHLNMRKVMTVGHSRGGEGVDRAAIKARAGDRFTIAGQVLVAPTDFGQQVAVGIPTTVLLPYCDGDVSDLQGQLFVDQSAGRATGDRALRTSVLVMGANHNYFNSQWTPSLAAAPAQDDWWDDEDPVCGSGAPQRLTAKQQRAVGSAYIAAAARTYLTSSTTARALLDGTPVRAASAGKAVVLTHALGGRRTGLVRADVSPHFRASAHATASVCAGFVDGSARPCARDDSVQSPHWSPLQWGWLPVAPHAVKVAWTAKAARVAFTPTRPLGSARYLDLRVIVPPQKSRPTFQVVVRDAEGGSTTLTPQRSASVLPGAPTGAGWAQNVRVRLPKGVVLAPSSSIVLRSTSSRGVVYLLDVYGSAPGLVRSTANVLTVARLSLPAATVVPVAVGQQSATLRIPVRGASERTGSVRLGIIDPQNGETTVVDRVIRPGQTSLDVRLARAWDDAYSDSEDGPDYVVVANATHNSVVDGYIGGVVARSAAERPHVVVDDVEASASPGQGLRWVVKLSGPVSRDVEMTVRAIPLPDPTWTELAGRDLLPGWAADHLAGAPSAAGVSAAGLTTSVVIPAYATSAVLEIPVRAGVSFTGVRHVALGLDTSEFGGVVPPLIGTVTSAG